MNKLEKFYFKQKRLANEAKHKIHEDFITNLEAKFKKPVKYGPLVGSTYCAHAGLPEEGPNQETLIELKNAVYIIHIEPTGCGKCDENQRKTIIKAAKQYDKSGFNYIPPK